MMSKAAVAAVADGKKEAEVKDEKWGCCWS